MLMDGICRHCLKPIRRTRNDLGLTITDRRLDYIHCGSRFGCEGHPAAGPEAQVAEPLTLKDVRKQLDRILVSVV